MFFFPPQISSLITPSPKTPGAGHPLSTAVGQPSPTLCWGSCCTRAPSWGSSGWKPSGVFSLRGAQPSWYAPASPSMRLCLPRLQIYLGKVETAFVYLSVGGGIYSLLLARAAKHAGSWTQLLSFCLHSPLSYADPRAAEHAQGWASPLASPSLGPHASPSPAARLPVSLAMGRDAAASSPGLPPPRLPPPPSSPWPAPARPGCMVRRPPSPLLSAPWSTTPSSGEGEGRGAAIFPSSMPRPSPGRLLAAYGTCMASAWLLCRSPLLYLLFLHPGFSRASYHHLCWHPMAIGQGTAPQGPWQCSCPEWSWVANLCGPLCPSHAEAWQKHHRYHRKSCVGHPEEKSQ